ncbi:MAG: 50S ribosomal protein L30 [candidate division WOR-3 bacterium]|uniref:50S ribosomal protein L30 n=1 Tax=candidate division WOR-3 bacterium TaxID=2052148 RepID=A0A7V4EAP6_UNCW3
MKEEGKNYIRIKQVRSRIGANWRAKRTLDALGLKKIGDVIIHKNLPQIRGMIERVKHLVEVEYVDSI